MNIARIISKFTPASPISWALELFRGLGGNTKGIDSSVNNLGSSLLGKYAGANLSGAEQQANEFNAQQAREQRSFEERMSNTTYQRTVADMQAAGLNPSVMLGGSAAGVSTPSGSTASSVSPSGGSLADLMSLVLLPAQLKQINAQTKNINANTKNTEQLARINGIVADYKVRFSDKELEQLDVAMNNLRSSTKLNESNVSFIDTQDEAQRITNRYLDERLRSEIDKIKSESLNYDASSARSLAEAAFVSIQSDYAAKHHVLMSSNDMVALASYLVGLLGIDEDSAFARARTVIGVINEANNKIDEGIKKASDYVDSVIEKIKNRKKDKDK